MKLVEIHREDIEALPDLMATLRPDPHRWVVFCDDLSFDADDHLVQVAQDGARRRHRGAAGQRAVLRHLEPPAPPRREMVENERSTAINPGEAVEEKVSLSDRFGLWLGFHKCSQDEYLAMIQAYAARYALPVEPDALRAEALEWATTRGSRSGRTAFQFIQDLAGRLGRTLD